MKYGLIGEKLSHSYSKEIHELIGRYEYELKPIAREALEDFIKGRDYKGLNVTIPYKEAVMPFLDEIDDSALKIGAVNTILNDQGKLIGYNTDYAGMKELFLRNGILPEGKKVLVLGTGGTSKTGRAVLQDLGAKEIITVSRTPGEDRITYEEMYAKHSDAEIILNTTPCGMYPNTSHKSVEIAGFSALQGVVDVIYNPNRTRLILEAEGQNIKATGGLYMLVMQAVKAAEIFTKEPVASEFSEKIYKKICGEKQNIVLIGMPASGKSVIGKKLAKALQLPFSDIDEKIVEQEKKSIPEIFRESGEEGFRKLETEVIFKETETYPKVISTGGGSVLKKENRDRLKENGVVIFIDRPLENLIPTGDRPLGNSKEKLEKLYKERRPIYLSTADHQVFNETIEETLQQIIQIF